jgi:hypothetical protein
MLQCWNEIKMNSNTKLNWCALKMVAIIEMISKFVKFDAQIIVWLIKLSWNYFKLAIEMENA